MTAALDDRRQERIRSWVSEVTESAAFWLSSPAWCATTARAECGAELVVWSDVGLFTVRAPAGVVAAHFDGTATIAELAEDLAEASGAPLRWTRELIATLTAELLMVGAVEAGSIPHPSPDVSEMAAGDPAAAVRPEEGEFTRIDPESGEAVRIVTHINPEGNLVTSEFGADGRLRLVSTMISFDSSRQDEAMDAAEVISGDRSAAEMVPPDSCLGSKLRNHDSVTLLSFRFKNQGIRSVRCHDVEVAEVLRAFAGDALVTGDERGPIEAFVVTPLEGSGPVRIYDGHGRRRGRPRTPTEAATVVDQVLGERLAETAPSDDGTPTPLGMILIGAPDGRGVLVPEGALDAPGALARLRTRDWVPTSGRAMLAVDRQVFAPSAFGSPAVSATEVEIMFDRGQRGLADRVVALVGSADGSGFARAARLHQAVALADRTGSCQNPWLRSLLNPIQQERPETFRQGTTR